MKKIFILEDDSYRIEKFQKFFKDQNVEVTYAMNIHDAKEIISKNTFDFWFLDHDLGLLTYVDTGEENTGSEFCRFVLKENINIPPTIIHSLNPNGALYMHNLLGNEKSLCVPFINLNTFYIITLLAGTHNLES